MHDLLNVKPTTRAAYSKQHTKCLINVRVTGWGTLISERALYSSKHTGVTTGDDERYSTHSTLPSCKKSAQYQQYKNLELTDSYRVTGLLINSSHQGCTNHSCLASHITKLCTVVQFHVHYSNLNKILFDIKSHASKP